MSTTSVSALPAPLVDGAQSRRAAIRPVLLESRRVKLSVATSGFCNARCELCVWPFMRHDPRIMSNDDFSRLLEMFRGYRVDKFAFNIINEPFVDKRVGEKVTLLAESGLRVKNLFFSSNWLIPSTTAVEAFARVVARTAAPRMKRVVINATVCGVDQASYDRYQGGRDLQDTVSPYRSLDFERAVGNVTCFMHALRDLGWPANVMMNLKAYGETLDQVTYAAFWRRRLSEVGLGDTLTGERVQVLHNHAFTTFARHESAAERTRSGVCKAGWLDARLAVGPGGDVGLCCEDGLSGISLGNLLEQGLDGVIGTSSYQRYLAEVLGQAAPSPDSPCVRCQFFDTVEAS